MNNNEVSAICPKIFILHGATCVGKSHINRRVEHLFLNFNTIESESKIYYDEKSANNKLIEYKKELLNIFKETANTSRLIKTDTLNDYLNKIEPGRFLCIVDFIKRVIIRHNMNCAASFTCSRLPLPDATSMSFYDDIMKLCNVEIIHILVTCKSDKKYKKQLKKKNRHNCKNTAVYISNYKSRLQNFDFYNHVITSPGEYIRVLDGYNVKRTDFISFMIYSIKGFLYSELKGYKIAIREKTRKIKSII